MKFGKRYHGYIESRKPERFFSYGLFKAALAEDISRGKGGCSCGCFIILAECCSVSRDHLCKGYQHVPIVLSCICVCAHTGALQAGAQLPAPQLWACDAVMQVCVCVWPFVLCCSVLCVFSGSGRLRCLWRSTKLCVNSFPLCVCNTRRPSCATSVPS